MPNYCVNEVAQANGDHEVHDLTASNWCLPNPTNRVDLGWHGSCVDAVAAARKYYTKVNGCYWCARACHTS